MVAEKHETCFKIECKKRLARRLLPKDSENFKYFDYNSIKIDIHGMLKRI
jgi:hypothetical protein